MKKSLLIYLVTLAIFGVATAFILGYGSRLNKQQTVFRSSAETEMIKTAPSPSTESEAPLKHTNQAQRENVRSTLSILLLQLIVIMVAARLVGRLFLKIGQPAVIGEMVAGILLGPSLLGFYRLRQWSSFFQKHQWAP